jgi:hypothetical protein
MVLNTGRTAFCDYSNSCEQYPSYSTHEFGLSQLDSTVTESEQFPPTQYHDDTVLESGCTVHTATVLIPLPLLQCSSHTWIGPTWSLGLLHFLPCILSCSYCYTFFLAFWVVHEHLVSYVILLLILLSCHLFVLSLCLDLLLHSLFHSCKRLVDNTYSKGYTIDNEGGIVIELKVIFYAIEKLVLTFQLA